MDMQDIFLYPQPYSFSTTEKQQLLNFVFSNFQLEGKRLLVTLREPFLTLSTMPHQPVSLRVNDSNIRPMD